MYKLLFSRMLFLLILPAISLLAQEKTPDEIKISEANKKALEEKEKKDSLLKEQEKKALENARNFFNYVKEKKSNELKKILSIPFIFDDEIIYRINSIDKMLENLDEDTFVDAQALQFSIDKQTKDYTDNNLVVIVKDNNTDGEITICIWLDKDSQKIIGFFVKIAEEDQNNNDESPEKIKKKAVKPKSPDQEAEQ